ncbi:unnamed protein product [Caenorhabditis brenneri]
MEMQEMKYPSLRILLEHLEANKRIELVRRCPSLNHVDKAVPMSMSYLFLDETQASINKHHYDVGVMRHYPKDGPKILKEYQRRNDCHGTAYDLDQYGRRDNSGNQVIEAGDIAIPTSYEPIIERTDEEEDLYMEQLEARLARLKRLRRMKQIQEKKEKIEAVLYEWNLRKENSRPPYSTYVQYTHTKSDETKTIERLEYNRKLHVAAKFMFNFLFFGRKHPIRVGYLHISDFGGVLRLPSDFKVKVRNLTTGFNFTPTMKSIEPLLVDRSIRNISVSGGSEISTDYIDNTTIKSADSFAMYGTPVTGNDFQIILESQNRKLYVTKGKITKDEYLTLFDNMRNVERKIGTDYSFGVHSKKLLKSFFDELKQREGVFSTRVAWQKQGDRFPLSYRALTNNGSTVSVYCTRNSNYNEKTREMEPWTIWFQIIKTVKVIEKSVEKGERDFVKLIDEFINTESLEIGTSDSFEIQSNKVVKEVFEEIQKRDWVTFKKEEKRGCTRFPFTFSLPIDNSSKLVIFCNRNKNLNKKGTKQKPWTMWFNVEKVEGMKTSEYESIDLVKRCPSLKCVDSVVPISLNYLYLSRTCTIINRVNYKIGIVRRYPKEGPKILKQYERINNDGGESYDLNEFGRRDRSGNEVLDPGDYIIETAHEPEIDRNIEEEDFYMEGRKRRLAYLKTLKKVEERQEEIERIEAKLFEWNLRRENRQPPYKMYIKYTRTNEEETKTIEYLEYNRKLYETAKYMFHYLFAGRKCPVRTNWLRISSIGHVLRLPVGLKIKTWNLATGYNFETIMDSVGSLLVDTTYEEVELSAGSEITTNLDHPVIKSAYAFDICYAKVTGHLFHIILADEHSRLNVDDGQCTVEEYLTLIDKMIDDKRAIGTVYSFGVQSKKLLKKLFNEVKNRAGVYTEKGRNYGCSRFPLIYCFDIDKNSLITISCNEHPKYKANSREIGRWRLWFEVRHSSGWRSSPTENKTEDEKKEFVKLMNAMINGKKEIGTCHSLEIGSKKKVKEVFEEMKKRQGVTFKREVYRGCTRFPFTFSLPINDSSKLSICCSRNKNFNKEDSNKKTWTLWFFVESIGDIITNEEYKKLLEKIVNDKREVGTRFPLAIGTKYQVKLLLNEVKNLDGVTFYTLKKPRFQLVDRCPCLKYVDKATPLSIDYLYLGNGCININNHTYSIGVIRQSPKQGPKLLKQYQRFNKHGGTEWELTEFGKLDFTSKVIYPGDILVESVDDRVERTPEEEDVRMEGYKRRLEHLKTLRKMKQRQKEMERIEAYLLEWDLCRENKKSPYTMYLQYTHKKPDETKTIEYLEYDRNFDEAAKYLYYSFFEDRKREIRVKSTKITSKGGVLRLPEYFRLNTKSITIGSNVESIINSLTPILTHQNFKSCCIYDGLSTGTNYNHPAVQSSPTCVIWNINLTGDLLHVVLNDTHSRLCVQHPKLTKEEYKMLIDKMIRDKRAVGTCYSFGIRSRNLVKAVLDEFKTRDGVTARKLPRRGCTRFPHTYILPIDSSFDFNIRCDRKEHYDEKKRENEPWTLWIRVDEKSKSEKRDTKEDYSKLFHGLLAHKTDIGWSVSALACG